MDRGIALLAGLFTVSGILHFVKPEPFEKIVPKPLPAKRELVYASGVAELAAAGLLVNRRTRHHGGRLSLAILVGVFPANVQMAIDVWRSDRAPLAFKIGTLARLPLQWPMIAIARRAAAADR